MKINKNRVLLITYLVFGTVLLLIENSLFIFLLINVLLLLLLIVKLKLDIKNPLLLFLIVFLIYQCSYPILNMLGIRVFEYEELNEKYYLLNWLATTSFLVFYGKIESIEYDEKKISATINIEVLRLLFILLSTISIISSCYIIEKGFQTKYELAMANNFLLKAGNISYTTLIIVPLLFCLGRNVKTREKKVITISTMVIMIIGMFTYGERSFLFNYLMVLFIYYFTKNKIDYKKIVLFALITIIFLPLTSSLKMLLTSDRYINNQNNNSVLVNFLNSDFSSAGFNFNYLLNNVEQSIFSGKTYIYDLLSPLEDFMPISKYSATKWYANTFWNTRKTGLGFSIIGEGWINFGTLGIVLEMLLLARMIKFFYKHSNINYYFYFVYLGFISLTMYSCRQALGNIISPLVKYYFLLAIGLYLINYNRNGKENEKIARE